MRPEVHSVQDVNSGFRRQRSCLQPRDAPDAHSAVQDVTNAQRYVQDATDTQTRILDATELALTFITISVNRRSEANHAPSHNSLGIVLNNVLHLCIHGILYSPPTTACYVQFPPNPSDSPPSVYVTNPPPSALRPCNKTTLCPTLQI